MPDNRTLQKRKTSDDVVEAIKHIIVDMDLQPGDKLPSQLKLSELLKVGSRSVREAVKSLEARGILETHHGKGVYLKNTNLDHFMEILSDSLIFNPTQNKQILLELTYVRKIIETNVIRDMAENPDHGTLKSLLDILDGMERAVGNGMIEEYNLLDINFHKTIIGASGNNIIISLYRYLSKLLRVSVTNTATFTGSLEDGMNDHRRLLEALVAKNPDLAGRIMDEHIQKTREKLEKLLD